MRTALPDIGQRKIIDRTHTEINQAVWVLCGQSNLAARTTKGFYDSGIHLEDICKSCLRGGKRGAPFRTRSYFV
jgi:hypothetical protein